MFTPRVSRIQSMDAQVISKGSPLQSPSKKGHQPQYNNQQENVPLSTYGAPLPVIVSEVMSKFRGKQITARVSECGWIWLVAGNKAYTWTYIASQQPMRCYQLSLPPCVAGNCSDRVLVTTDDENAIVCYAATAQGHVRYWSNIKQENLFVECDLGLSDQLIHKLYVTQNTKLVFAASTKCFLFSLSGSKATVSGQPLLENSGVLANVSRRVSSFIFGSGPTRVENSTYRSLATATQGPNGDEFVYLLTNDSLSKISCQKRMMYYKINLMNLIGQSLSQQLTYDNSWLIDLQPTKTGVIVLFGFISSPRLISLSLAHINTLSLIAPYEVEKVTPLSISLDMPGLGQSNSIEKNLSSFHLIYPDVLYQTAYIRTPSTVYVISVSHNESNVNQVEFKGQNEELLALGYHKQGPELVPIVFSRQRFLMALNQSTLLDKHVGAYVAQQSQVMDESMVTDFTLHHADPDPETSFSVKAVFLRWLKDGQPSTGYPVTSLYELGSKLDGHICNLSLQIVDDVPVNDPRWSQTISHRPHAQGGLGSTQSVLLANQLQGKLLIQHQFLTFLTTTGITDKLTTFKGVRTKEYLYEMTEYIIACKTIRQLHDETPDLIDDTITRVLISRKADVPTSLTPSDVFYREVSKVSDFFGVLMDYELDQLKRLADSKDVIALVSNTSIVFVTCILEVTKYREAAYLSSLFERRQEYLPWTKHPSVLDFLTKQFEASKTHALPACSSSQEVSNVSQQMADLADLICDGLASSLMLKNNSGSVHDVDDNYISLRNKLLKTFVEMEQYERAAELAEKYLDFAILIDICEKTSNNERLDRYSKTFASHGFSEFLFDYYAKSGKRSQILEKLKVTSDADMYLQDDSKLELRWLHGITTGDFDDSHRTLAQLALKEKKSLRKKQTLFSLSKLCALASDDADELCEQINAINKQLTLIKYQQGSTLSHSSDMNLDEDMMVMTVPEIIQAYIGDNRETVTEVDLKRALDLLMYCDSKEEERSLRSRVWSTAILQDSWNYASDTPIADCSSKMFFKLIEMIASDLSDGDDLMLHIPSLNSVLELSELKTLVSSPTFVYLLKAGYEHLQNLYQNEAMSV